MSIKATLSSDGDGVEVMYTPPTLMEMCLYKCLTNKEILTTEVEVEEGTDGNEHLDWEKFRLKKPIYGDIVNALLDAGGKFLFALTPKYEPLLAAILMSQPEDLVKVHVSNTDTLRDDQLHWLISGGNVKSLDIHGCVLLSRGSLLVINKFGSKLEYLRLGNSSRILPAPAKFNQHRGPGILKTSKLKTFIISDIKCESSLGSYWRFLLKDFVSNLEDLRISSSDLETLDFLEPAKDKLSSLTLSNCVVSKNTDAWAPLFKLDKLRFLDLIASKIGDAFSDDDGENVVQRLRTALPNLTHLNIDPGLVGNVGIFVTRQEGERRHKRLEFLGTMADVDEMEKVKLLANQVAGFGSTAGELRALEYYADRLNSGYLNSSLGKFLARFTAEGTASDAVVGVVMLFMKALKNNGIHMMYPAIYFEILHSLITLDVPVKLGDVIFNQFVDFVGIVLRSLRRDEPRCFLGNRVIHYTIDMLLKLDCKLCLDYYEAAVLAEIQIFGNSWTAPWKMRKDCVVKIARFFERTAEGFPNLFERGSNIEWIPVIIREYKELMSYYSKRFRSDEIIRDSFCSILSSLRKLCFLSGPCRAAFHDANGVKTMIDLMSDNLEDQVLDFSECDGGSYIMLEILNIVLQDTTLTEFSKTIPSELEKYLLTLHSKDKEERWELWECPEDAFYVQRIMQMAVSLLSYLETDPRFDYEGPAASAKEIIAKLK